MAKARKTEKEKRALLKLQKKDLTEVNMVDHYDLWYTMFDLLKRTPDVHFKEYSGDYHSLVHELGFEDAYHKVMDVVCCC